MFSLLLESGTRGPRRHPGWTLGSTTAHGMLIVLALAATTRAALPTVEGEQLQPVLVYRETPPVSAPPREAGADGSALGGADVVRLPTISFPTVVLPLLDEPLTAQPLASTSATSATATASDAWPAPGTQGVAPANGVYRDGDVDRPVAARRSNGQPRYPAALRTASVEGEVLVRFVVDSSGRVEPGSIEIVRGAHALFGQAVSEWLSRNRYDPARVEGRAVRQLVEQRVNFSLADRHD